MILLSRDFQNRSRNLSRVASFSQQLGKRSLQFFEQLFAHDARALPPLTSVSLERASSVRLVEARGGSGVLFDESDHGLAGSCQLQDLTNGPLHCEGIIFQSLDFRM